MSHVSASYIGLGSCFVARWLVTGLGPGHHHHSLPPSPASSVAMAAQDAFLIARISFVPPVKFQSSLFSDVHHNVCCDASALFGTARTKGRMGGRQQRTQRYSEAHGVRASTLDTQIRQRFPLSVPRSLVLPETFWIDSLIEYISVFITMDTLVSPVPGSLAFPEIFKIDSLNEFTNVFMTTDTLHTPLSEARRPAFGPVPPKLQSREEVYLADETPSELFYHGLFMDHLSLRTRDPHNAAPMLMDASSIVRKSEGLSTTGSFPIPNQTGVLIETLLALSGTVLLPSGNIFSTQDHAAVVFAKAGADQLSHALKPNEMAVCSFQSQLARVCDTFKICEGLSRVEFFDDNGQAEEEMYLELSRPRVLLCLVLDK